MRVYLINPSNPLVRRVWRSVWHRRQPLITLVGNLSYRSNIHVDRRAYANFQRHRGCAFSSHPTRHENPLATLA